MAVGIFGWFLLCAAPALPAQEGVQAKLDKKVNTPAFDENTPIKDALAFLADRYDLTIVVDTKAFAEAKIQKVEEQPIKLAAMKDTALGTIFEQLVKQVGGKLEIQKDKVVVVPAKK
jgi:hypothetical protein